MAGFLQRCGEAGEVTGDLAGDFGADFRGVEREGIEPDEAEALADLFVAQILEPDAEAARIGEGLIGAAGLGEVGVDFDAVADIDDEEEGRGGSFSGRCRA